METSKKITYRDIFHQKEYIKLIIAAIINRFGDSIDAIAFTWIVYEISGNAALSAVVYGVNKLPTIFLTPVAGTWVEGKKKKNIMVVTDIIRAICVAMIATGYYLHMLQPWMLIIITLLISSAEAFRIPAGSSLTPKVLTREYYEYGMSLMTTLTGIVELIGTITAAGIIAIIGVSGAIYLDMITFILSALIILYVKVKEKEMKSEKYKSYAFITNLKDGFSYVKKEKTVWFLLFLAVFLNGILVPVNSLQAPMVDEILHSGAEALSFFGASISIGMMIGSFIYPEIKKKVSGKFLLISCCLSIAFFYIGIPLAMPLYKSKVFTYAWLCAISGITGMIMATTSSFINVLCISVVEERYMARFFGILTSVSVVSVPAFSFITSVVVKKIGISSIFYISGILSMIAILFIITNNNIEGSNTDKTIAMEE